MGKMGQVLNLVLLPSTKTSRLLSMETKEASFGLLKVIHPHIQEEKSHQSFHRVQFWFDELYSSVLW